jgi:hypothetical protein
MEMRFSPQYGGHIRPRRGRYFCDERRLFALGDEDALVFVRLDDHFPTTSGAAASYAFA